MRVYDNSTHFQPSMSGFEILEDTLHLMGANPERKHSGIPEAALHFLQCSVVYAEHAATYTSHRHAKQIVRHSIALLLSVCDSSFVDRPYPTCIEVPPNTIEPKSMRVALIARRIRKIAKSRIREIPVPLIDLPDLNKDAAFHQLHLELNLIPDSTLFSNNVCGVYRLIALMDDVLIYVQIAINAGLSLTGLRLACEIFKLYWMHEHYHMRPVDLMPYDAGRRQRFLEITEDVKKLQGRIASRVRKKFDHSLRHYAPICNKRDYENAARRYGFLS